MEQEIKQENTKAQKQENTKNPFFGKSLDNKKDELKEMEHKYKKALADYQNLLKRTAIEKEEYVKYANEQILHEILPVYDNLKLAVAHANGGENGAVIEGVRHVLSQFKNILENFGIQEIKTVGEKFDHYTMEAVEKKKTENEEKDGTVESELMSGYRLGERVIRAARVAVYELITHIT